MKAENELIVCALCGGTNIEEERMITIGVISKSTIKDVHIGYFCGDCCDVVDVISKKEYDS